MTDLREIARVAVESLVERFGATWAEAYFVDREGTGADLAARAPMLDSGLGADATPGQPSVAASRRVVDLARAGHLSTLEHSRWPGDPVSPGGGTGQAEGRVLAVPLAVADRCLGLLALCFDAEPSAQQVAAVDAFAQAVAATMCGAERLLERQLQVEQSHLLQQARESEARFRGLLESAPDAVVIVEPDGEIVLVNRQAEALFGYRRDELLGQPIELLIPEAVRTRHVGLRGNYTADPKTRPMGMELDLRGRRKDGSEVPVEISLSPMRSGSGLLITSVIRDVTERRRIDEQFKQTAMMLARQSAELVRSNEELQQFAYVASHDLQEPLRMVASYTQLLQRRYQGRLDADADEFIAYAVDGATRMQALINDLLTYSRVGMRTRPFVEVDCGHLADRCISDLAALIEEMGATVTREDLPTVIGDSTELSQLLLNLLANAIKFHGERAPRVHLSAQRSAEEWLFSVRDNGIGIEPDYVDRIFVIFQRLHSREEYPGTGIGLAICKKIVERHGGRIWVTSEPGQGSTFWFTIPVERTEDP